jgi:hypothetical protein
MAISGDDPPHRFKDDDIVPAAHEAKADRSVLAFDGAILAQTATERVRELCSRFQRHKPTTGIAGCCARAANGQAAAPPVYATNSHRLVSLPKPEGRNSTTSKEAFVQHSKLDRPTSGLVISLGGDRGRGPIYVRSTSNRVEILCTAVKDAKCHFQT